MTKTHWTLEEIRDTLSELDIMGLGSCVMPPNDVIDMVMYVERLFYNKHVDDIRARRAKLKNSWTDETGFLSFWFDQDRHIGYPLKDIILPGCHECLFGSINHIRHSDKCTQNCDFCYYHETVNRQQKKPIGKNLYSISTTEMSFTVDEMKVLIDRQAGKYTSIGWLQKEPLEEFEAIEPIMQMLAKKGLHQYMYTNGVKATYPVIDKLAEWGLDELRFNLQSSNFSDKVLDNMQYAAQKLQWVGIETPMYSKSFKNFIKHKDTIVNSGIHQINLPELQVCSLPLIQYFWETEGPVYKHRRGYVSPITSRHFTYDLIEIAEEEKWPIVINDCSNDTKFYRGANKRAPFGVVGYESAFELPFQNILYLAEQVLEEGVTYEFF